MANRNLFVWVVVIVVIIIIGWYLLEGGLWGKDTGANDMATTSTGAILNQIGSTSTTTTPPILRVVEMTARNFSFDPKTISANQGDTVELRIHSTGTHDITVPALGISQPLADGQVTIIRFTPENRGIFPFYCSIGTHREQGMTGTLSVN